MNFHELIEDLENAWIAEVFHQNKPLKVHVCTKMTGGKRFHGMMENSMKVQKTGRLFRLEDLERFSQELAFELGLLDEEETAKHWKGSF